MLKSFTFSILSILLVVSILAPSVEALYTSDSESILVMDLNEEENGKETEKKFDEKEMFFSNSIVNKTFFYKEQLTAAQTYSLIYSEVSTEVVLPPPKRLI